MGPKPEKARVKENTQIPCNDFTRVIRSVVDYSPHPLFIKLEGIFYLFCLVVTRHIEKGPNVDRESVSFVS